jgi:YVTN family beta-propeller protein
LAQLIGLAFLAVGLLAPASAGAAFSAPTYSSPITLSANGKLLWVVSPATDQVAVINTATNRVIKKVRVGDQPEGVAVDDDNRYAFVANTADGTVTVIRILRADPANFNAAVARDLGNNGTFLTGAEPWNIVASTDGRRIFVANSSQDSITVIDATRRENRAGRLISPRVIGHIALRGSQCSPNRQIHFQPRGLAVSKDSNKLFVTQFFSFQRQGFTQVNDQGRQGRVCRIDINTNSQRIGGYRPADRIQLLPRDTGFAIDKTLDGQPDPTFAWPNQLQSIVIRGGQAFLPNIAASPEGPQRFNTTTQAFVNVINGITGANQADGSGSKFLNLHLGARTPEAGKTKLFFANPWAIAFTNQRGNGNAYVVSAGSDLLVKLNVAGNGDLNFTGGPSTTRYIDLNDPDDPSTDGLEAGKNPQGIVINRQGTRAWVMNFVSRNVSVVNLNTDEVIRSIRTAPLPRPGSREETVLVGAEIFFSSRGHFDRPPGTTVSTEDRLSSEGWQNCASCHFAGLTDSVVWAFGSGPRKSIPLNATFNPSNRNQQKVLNYSAIFDEVEDFELNIRNVSGPGPLAAAQPCANPPPPPAPATSTFDPNHGLLFADNGDRNLAPCLINNIPALANANRQEHTVTLPGSNVAVPALTAMKEWVRFAVRTPDAPFQQASLGASRLRNADVRAGQRLFEQQGCTNCHGPSLFSSSIKDFTSPPPPARFANERTGTFAGNPIGLNYMFEFLRDIGSFNLGVPGQGNELGNNIGGPELAASAIVGGVTQAPQDALGRDYNNDGRGNGFSPPSLLGIDASPPFYHNGACETLACVLSNVKHRTALGTLPDRLTNARARNQVVQFLRALD